MTSRVVLGVAAGLVCWTQVASATPPPRNATRTRTSSKLPALHLRFNWVNPHSVTYEHTGPAFTVTNPKGPQISLILGASESAHILGDGTARAATLTTVGGNLLVNLSHLDELPDARTRMQLVVKPYDKGRTLWVRVRETFDPNGFLHDAVRASMLLQSRERRLLLSELPSADMRLEPFAFDQFGNPVGLEWQEGDVTVILSADDSGDRYPIIERRIRHGQGTYFGNLLRGPSVWINNASPPPVMRPPDRRVPVDWDDPENPRF